MRQTQLYATSDGKPVMQRANISEKSLFAHEKPYGWAYFYEKARRDLFLIMDDSWDVPVEDDPSYYGSLHLNGEKFPEATEGTETNAEALRRLTEKIKGLDWKGLGGWVCAQESERFLGDQTEEEYWTERLLDAQKSGFCYWKVDWGKKGSSPIFRQMMSDMAKKIAPDLIIEHAITKEIIPTSDVYRTYDVPAIMSIPMTMEKISENRDAGKPENGYMGLLNCEDEVYIAAAGGFAIGIERHPYVGAFPDGRADMSFPEIHRNLKTKMTEIVRAVRWHRIAPAFGMDRDEIFIDSARLSDSWRFVNSSEEIESWWLTGMPQIRDCIQDGVVAKTAPARISRRTPLPEVMPDAKGQVPYILAAKNPNGAFSVVTAGRTIDRDYFIPACKVTVMTGDASVIGIFGRYESITLETDLNTERMQILAQDLADEHAYDISEFVTVESGRITIPGDLIDSIGTAAQPEGDTSEPGLVIKIMMSNE